MGELTDYERPASDSVVNESGVAGASVSDALDTLSSAIIAEDLWDRSGTYTYLKNTGDNVGIGTVTPDTKLQVLVDDGQTNKVTNLAKFTHTTTGTPAIGIGARIQLEVETSAGNNEILGEWEASATNVGSGTEESTFILKNFVGGNANNFLTAKGLSVGINESNPDRTLHINLNDGSNSSVTYLLRLTHNTSGLPAIGIGTGIEFETETAGSNQEIGATLETESTNINAGTEAFDVIIKTMQGGLAADEAIRITSDNWVGIGTVGAMPSANLHVRAGVSTSPFSTASNFIIENNANVRMILSGGTSNTGKIHFGDDVADDSGRLEYDHNSNQLNIWVNDLQTFKIESDGTLVTTTANYETLVLADDDIPNKKYVDDAVAVEDLWDRSGSVLSPKNVGDDISFGAASILSTNGQLYEQSATQWRLRNSTDTGFVGLYAEQFWASQYSISTGIDYWGTTTGTFDANSSDDAYVSFKAKDNGVGLVEVARLKGGDDPYFDVILGGTYTTHTTLDIVGKGSGATKTATYIHDNIIGEQFGVNDEIFLETHIVHDYDSGDLTIEVDFEPLAAEASKFIRWQLNYKCYNHGEVSSGNTGSSPLDSGDIALNATQYYVQNYGFTIPAADFAGKDYIRLKLLRITSTGTAPGTSPGVISVEGEYTAKRIPS